MSIKETREEREQRKEAYAFKKVLICFIATVLGCWLVTGKFLGGLIFGSLMCVFLGIFIYEEACNDFEKDNPK